ncbi:MULTISPECIES: TlpA family protein disulfide reductase [unclassified Streptomyces]|uniref:TlpA family protein disulfide reductase n=1 Tax=unclassified Streptomyces TaxID=2593676 RepID=UPI0035E10C1A
MSVTTTVVVCLNAVVGVLNLVLLLALARRIADSGHGHGGNAGEAAVTVPENRLADGSPVPAFRVTTRHDGEIDETDVPGPAAVGFFSTTCRPCREQAPGFARIASTVPGGRDRVVAVIKGAGKVADDLVEILSPVARVVVEADDENDPTLRPGVSLASEAFGIVRWPSYVEIGADGRITHRESATELFADPAELAPQTV